MKMTALTQRSVLIVLLMLVMGPYGCSKGDGGATGAGSVTLDNGIGGGFGVLYSASLEVTPTEIIFGEVLQPTRTVTVSNLGTETGVVLTAIRLKLADPKFALDVPEALEIPPLGTLEFQITYTPGEDYNGDTIVIEYGAGGQAVIQIPISIALGESGVAVAPLALDFGAVALGDSFEREFYIENLGTATATIHSIEFSAETEEDYSFAAEEQPVEVAPGELLEIGVVFSPDGVGFDTGEVRVVAGPDNSLSTVYLSGDVTGPKLIAIPGVADFGFVSLEAESVLDVTLKNAGTAGLTLDLVTLDTWSQESLSLEDMPSFPLSLEPDESTSVAIRFAPSGTEAPSLDPIGALLAAGTGTAQGALSVPIYGNVAAPELMAIPDFLDFGLVASGDTKTESLVLRNVGKAPLQIDSVTLDATTSSEFAVGAVSGGGLPAVLSADDMVTVEVSFTNQGQEGTLASGTLEVVSSDPQNPTTLVGMEANRGGAKSCIVELSPPSLNYGIVAHGFTKTMPVTIKNVGSGPCTYLSTTTYECDALGGIFGGGSCSPGLNGSSKYFKVVAQPPPIPSGIPSGGAATVQIMFVPPDNAPLIDFFDAYTGAFQVSVTDPSNGGSVVQSPVGATPGDLQPNLNAQSGISSISVIPSTIDFGLVTIGCSSPEQKVTIYNNGNAPLNVSDIALENCTPEFEITQLPPIPPDGLIITQNSPVELYVKYKPQVPETSFCTIAIQSTDQDQALLTVPMQGTGTFETEITELFTQVSGQLVDILFVVDDSGSMSDEQSNLAQNFNALIQEANTWGSDYRLGVVTTDIDNSDVAGKLQGSPKFVSPGPNAENDFKDNVQVGDSGTGAQEAGLEAANLALSMPLIYEGGTCAVDADCEDFGSGLTCGAGGVCYGHNGGFLREDAALELVFVSDEEDQSPGPLNFYIDFFKSIKGFANEDLMHAHAIVGDKGGGCDSGNGTADAGNRYIEVAEQTGGKVGSICAADFSTVLASIGDVAFGLKVQFFLSAQAEAGTVTVAVNGAPADGNCWSYDVDSNTVIFVETGACVPEEGDTIAISYKLLCLP